MSRLFSHIFRLPHKEQQENKYVSFCRPLNTDPSSQVLHAPPLFSKCSLTRIPVAPKKRTTKYQNQFHPSSASFLVSHSFF